MLSWQGNRFDVLFKLFYSKGASALSFRRLVPSTVAFLEELSVFARRFYACLPTVGLNAAIRIRGRSPGVEPYASWWKMSALAKPLPLFGDSHTLTHLRWQLKAHSWEDYVVPIAPSLLVLPALVSHLPDQILRLKSPFVSFVTVRQIDSNLATQLMPDQHHLWMLSQT